MSKYLYLIFLIFGILFGYLMNEYFNIPDREIIYEEIVKRDTVTKYIEHNPIIIKNAKPKIIYRTDSVFITKPFLAVLDTVYIRDTIRMKYAYPENSFSLMIRNPSDTIRIPQITKIRTKKENWWIKPIVFLSGALTGYFANN